MNENTPTIVITELDQAINDCHNRAISAARKTEEAMLEFANEVVKCGTLLLTKRSEFGKKSGNGKPGWMALFTGSARVHNNSVIYAFTHMTGNRYMRVASKHPKPFASWGEAAPFLKDVGIIAGALPEPHRDGQQQSHSFTVSDFAVSIAGFISSSFAKFDYDAALTDMPQHSKDSLRDLIAPAKQKLDELWDKVA